MFRGYDEITMDAKGRIGMPTRYHERLLAHCEGKFVITVDLRASCLVVYPLPEWEMVEAQFNALPSSSVELTRLKRRILGHATEVSLDSAGRLLLSPELRAFAQLEKGVVLTGQGKKAEIWSKANWDAEQAAAMAVDLSAPELAAHIDALQF